MCGKNDKIACNVGDEQTAKSEEADGVHASRDNAKDGREQFRIERALHQRCPQPGRPAFNYPRHVANRALWSEALAQTNARRTARSWRLFSDILVKQK
jgi:hypothetical protein